MGVKFAGSRSIDERRRRRLAGENEVSSPPATAAAPKSGFWNQKRTRDEAEQPPVTPLASLLPASRVRIWSLCAAVPLVGLLLVLFSQHHSLISDLRLRTIFDLQQGHLWRFVRGVLFLGAAGLCWLVSWFRSASDRDFEGCYKSWYFSGWIFLAFGLVAGADAHLVFAQIVGDYTQLQQPFLRTLFWAVPMAALLLEPMRCFTLEMWHCRRSCFMLALCSLSALVYLEMKVPSSEAPEFFSAQSSQFIAMVASVLAPSLLFSALLSQVYYVMHVSSDPVCRRQSWVWVGITWVNNKMLTGLKSVTNYCYRSIGNITRSTRSRLMNRSEHSTKSREERKAERKLARQKLAEEKALKKQTVQAEKKAIAEEKKRAKEQARAKKQEAKVQQAEEAKEKELEKKALEAERKLEKQTKRSSRSKRKQTPFKQVAADQHEKKETASSKQTENNQAETNQAESKQTAKSQRTNKPRVRLKSQPVTTAQQTPQPPQDKAKLSVRHRDEDNNESEKQAKTVAKTAESDRIDPSNLKGLSKKERRRIRKLHREQQRANTRKAG